MACTARSPHSKSSCAHTRRSEITSSSANAATECTPSRRPPSEAWTAPSRRCRRMTAPAATLEKRRLPSSAGRESAASRRLLLRGRGHVAARVARRCSGRGAPATRSGGLSLRPSDCGTGPSQSKRSDVVPSEHRTWATDTLAYAGCGRAVAARSAGRFPARGPGVVTASIGDRRRDRYCVSRERGSVLTSTGSPPATRNSGPSTSPPPRARSELGNDVELQLVGFG